MYVGVDVGGTKTLVAVLDDSGQIVERDRFPTPKKYEDFLSRLDESLSHFMHHDFKAGGVGVRGTVDRVNGRRVNDQLLPWGIVPLQADVESITKCPIALENDAKLAGLSESLLVKDQYKRVLYVTVSTGIGFGLIVNGKIDPNTNDLGGQSLLLEHRGKLMAWEDFAGGKAIAIRYGKQAKDIDDQATWQTISRDLAKGLLQLIAIMTPEVIIFGGSVGAYFDKYHQLLDQELKQHEVPLVALPVLQQAQRPDEAVVFGCYDLAKQALGHA